MFEKLRKLAPVCAAIGFFGTILEFIFKKQNQREETKEALLEVFKENPELIKNAISVDDGK